MEKILNRKIEKQNKFLKVEIKTTLSNYLRN